MQGIFTVKMTVFILMVCVETRASMESIMERARGDAAAWGNAVKIDHAASIEENFKGPSLEESPPPTTVEEIAKRKITHPVFKDLEDNRFKRPVYLKPHLEYKDEENPMEVLKDHFKGCRRVYKIKRALSLHECLEGRPEMQHMCHRYLKEAETVEKGEFFKHSDVSGWRDGLYHYTSSDKIPLSRNYKRFDGTNWWWETIIHVYVYKKRAISLDIYDGSKKEGPWVDISKEEYDAPTPADKDIWVSDCGVLEERARVGLCRKIGTKCISEGKVIERDSKIERECFQEEDTYVCGGSSVDTCRPLREQGCYQQKSECVEELGGECVLFKMTLECQKETGEQKEELVCGGPYCLDGSCGTTEFPPNKDMMDVLTKLQTLSEVAKQSDHLRIFSGRRLQCSKDIMSFRDCCRGWGWGASMNLAGCSEEDSTLKHQRSRGLCVEVGTYCAHRESITKLCLTKKTSFCCFPNKLLKAVQEQGRAQLGIGWGSPKETDCRGLTPEELSRIDFTRLDLREAVEEVTMNRAKIHDTLKDRMATITADLGTLTNESLLKTAHPKMEHLQVEHPKMVPPQGEEVAQRVHSRMVHSRMAHSSMAPRMMAQSPRERSPVKDDKK